MTPIRKMQLYEVEMIKVIDNIFKENNIKYILIGGSVLGAIRHKGFIPWDDDMDIGIFRYDFSKAEQLLASLDGYIYESAEEHQIPDAPIGHLHLVNSEYTLANSPTIDIFALDGIPAEVSKQKQQRRAANWYHLDVLHRPSVNRGFINKIITTILLFVIPKAIWKKIRKYSFSRLTAYNAKTSPLIGNIFGVYGIKEYFPRMFFDLISTTAFEGLELPIPAKYDAYLTQLYGNYMELPPIEKRVPKHKKINN